MGTANRTPPLAREGGMSSILTPMGRRMREEHFLFEKGFVNLNHGMLRLLHTCVVPDDDFKLIPML